MTARTHPPLREPAPTPVPVAPHFTRVDEELRGRFGRFIEEASRFSRGIVSIAPNEFPADPAFAAERNLALLRSVFAKWNLEILSVLYSFRELGFEEMRRRLGTVTARVLSRKLRALRERGLVHRAAVLHSSLRVRYSLTPRGLAVAKLGEPVLLYLRLTVQRSPTDDPSD